MAFPTRRGHKVTAIPGPRGHKITAFPARRGHTTNKHTAAAGSGARDNDVQNLYFADHDAKTAVAKAGMKGYGQFCPVAKASEIVAERWTPLILRELLCGSRRFNDLRKGVPLMSPSLLSQRLKELEDAGVLERRAGPGTSREYYLTRAGHELRPIIEMLGNWGNRWAQRGIGNDVLDPAFLMWDIRRGVAGTQVSEGRMVVQFDLTGVPSAKSRWWLVFDRGEVDLCLKDPGYDVDLRVTSPIGILVDVWLGNVDLAHAIRFRSIRVAGAFEKVRGFEKWFGISMYAQPVRSERNNGTVAS